MATANDIAVKALRRLGLINAGESAAAADIALCADALSSLIASWDNLGFVGETLPIAARFEHGLVAMLAVRVAEDFGVSPGPILRRDASDGEDSLLAAFVPVRAASVDNALIAMSGGASAGYAMRRLNRPPLAEWAGGYDYKLGDRAYNGSSIYLCTTAGTSASAGGPSGSGSEISDGSVIWQWERVFGG